MRIRDVRLLGDLSGLEWTETAQEHSIIWEDLAVKSDVYISCDGGETWELNNPGCKDQQEDVLLQMEVWLRDRVDYSLPKYTGSIGGKNYNHRTATALQTTQILEISTYENMYVCLMFSPRMQCGGGAILCCQQVTWVVIIILLTLCPFTSWIGRLPSVDCSTSYM